MRALHELTKMTNLIQLLLNPYEVINAGLLSLDAVDMLSICLYWDLHGCYISYLHGVRSGKASFLQTKSAMFYFNCFFKGFRFHLCLFGSCCCFIIRRCQSRYFLLKSWLRLRSDWCQNSWRRDLSSQWHLRWGPNLSAISHMNDFSIGVYFGKLTTSELELQRC